jgi:hypothetical protein
MIYLFTYLIVFSLVSNEAPPSENDSYKTTTEYWGNDSIKVISNAFVVKFHDSEQNSKSKMSEFEFNFNVKITERIGLDWYIGIFESNTSGSSTTDRIREIQKNSEGLIHLIEPLFALKLSFEPNDPLYVGNSNDIEHNPGQWYLKNTGNILPNSILGADSKVWQAWEMTKGSANLWFPFLIRE